MSRLTGAEQVKTAYRRYADVYDRLFGAVFEQGRIAAVKEINTRPGQKILEVGVGTGLSLAHYRRDATVHGIDISSDMLKHARQRVERLGLTHVESLQEMDAQAKSYPDASFDCVVGMYVASVVPDPRRMLAEMRRVCVPGGDILIVNHFTSRHPVVRGVEKALSPLAVHLGFHPDFELQELLDMADMQVVSIKPVNMFGYWKLIRLRNVPALSQDTRPLDVAAAE